RQHHRHDDGHRQRDRVKRRRGRQLHLRRVAGDRGGRADAARPHRGHRLQRHRPPGHRRPAPRPRPPRPARGPEPPPPRPPPPPARARAGGPGAAARAAAAAPAPPTPPPTTPPPPPRGARAPPPTPPTTLPGPPQLVTPAGGDFALAAGSPLIGSGDP